VGSGFLWRDAGRVIVFGEGVIADAPRLLDEHGFAGWELLTTERALAGHGHLADSAETVHLVPPGQVPGAAGRLLESVGGRHLLAFGGGRVIDAAKAVAAVGGAEVAAAPTTLSGAEMTAIHRLPAGAEARARGLVRPRLVLAEPAAMTGLPEARLRASALNALAHGADSLYAPFANPVSRMTALRGAELIADGLDRPRGERDRGAPALGASLCGYAIDSGGFALHHVVCQTLVRVCGSPHAETNAAVLPPAMAFMAPRAPEQISALAVALGCPPERIERRIRELGGNPRGLGEVGAERASLGKAVDAMLERTELGFTPGAPDRAELLDLVERAW
jgi:maleylacetate reductase